MTFDLALFLIYLLGYAICSGCNVAYFARSHREHWRDIEIGSGAQEGSPESKQAERSRAILSHLANPNWTLAAILLTNVFFGVKLSQLSEVIFSGIWSVVLPIFAITIVGEFFAQATFLRYSNFVCALCSGPVWVLKYLTAPASFPLAAVVNHLYGKEALTRLDERDLLGDLELELKEFGHLVGGHESVLDKRELQILINVARGDDEPARMVGQRLNKDTIVFCNIENGSPDLGEDPSQFIREHLQASSHPWFVLVDAGSGLPVFLLDADGFVRDFYSCAINSSDCSFDPMNHVYRAHVYTNIDVTVGAVLSDLRIVQTARQDEVVDVDVALVWSSEEAWIVTGGDILGRFLRGVPKVHWRTQREMRRGKIM